MILQLLAMTDPVPTDYITLGGQIIIAILACMTAGFGLWAKRSHRGRRALEQKLDEVLHELQNDHSTNLRDDVDRKFAETAAEMRRGFTGVHQRMDSFDLRLDHHIDRGD